MPLFLVLVADQEGDPDWELCRTFEKARDEAIIMQETAFDRPKIYRVDPGTLEHKELDWRA